MTRWKAQGLAVAMWLVGAVGVGYAMPVSGGFFSFGDAGRVITAMFFGAVGLAVGVVSSVAVAAWKSASPQAVAWMHAGLVVLVWLVWTTLASWGG